MKRGHRTPWPNVTELGPGVFVIRLQIAGAPGSRVDRSRKVRASTAREAAQELARWQWEVTGQRPLPLMHAVPALPSAHAELTPIVAPQAPACSANLMAAPEAPAQPVFGEFAALWLDLRRPPMVDPYTWECQERILRVHLLPAFGAMPLRSITSLHVQAWLARSLASRRWAAITVHGWFRLLRTLIRDAIAQYGLSLDPTLRVRMPRGASFDERPRARGRQPLTGEAVAALLEHVRAQAPQHYALLVFLAETGLRFSHIAGLRWSDIDLARCAVRIARKIVNGVEGRISRVKPAPRETALTARMREALEFQRAVLDDPELSSPAASEAGHALLFPTVRGGVRRPQSMRKLLRAACVAVGIAPITVHSFRRTHADLSRLAGVDPLIQNAARGHVTEAMRAHYSTIALSEIRACNEAVSAQIAGAAKK